MDRQEGYYWVKYKNGSYAPAEWWQGSWIILGNDEDYKDLDFEHINEVRIKNPGELPD